MDSAKYVTQHERIYKTIGKKNKTKEYKNKDEYNVQYNKMCWKVYCRLNT